MNANALTVEVADFFLLRVPSLPLEALSHFRRVEGRLDSLLGFPGCDSNFLEEAILLASDDLHKAIFLEGGPSVDARASLLRYLYRMSVRPTPYGLFAGVAVGKVGSSTDLQIRRPSFGRKVARVDQGLVCRTQAEMAMTPLSLDASRNVEVRLSSSAWRSPSGWRYVEYISNDAATKYELACLAEGEGVRLVTSLLADGISDVHALIRELCLITNQDHETVSDFVQRLRAEKFLTIGSEVAVSGVDPTKEFVNSASSYMAGHPAVDLLVQVQNVVDDLNAGVVDNRVAAIRSITSLAAGASLAPSAAKVMQMDLHLRSDNLSLSARACDDLMKSIVRLLPIISRDTFSLIDFAREFERRYGDASVPLLEVLDEDFGIGFRQSSRAIMPLLSGIPLRGASSRQNLSQHDVFWASEAQKAAVERRNIISIDDVMLAKFKAVGGLPSSGCILGSYSENDTFHLRGVFGPPAGVLLGRFGAGNDELAERLRSFQKAPSRFEPGSGRSIDVEPIDAELVHLPQGRVGNVILRPTLSSYEVTYMGGSSLDKSGRIPASDLDVFCRNGVVSLWDRKSGRPVRIRMSHAHNFDNALNLPVYRFLGSVARQGEPLVGFSWGAVAENFEWLPSVRFQNVVLAEERWLLSRPEVQTIHRAGPERLLEWSERRGLPTQIRIVEGDNYLELDLRYSTDREIMLNLCERGRPLFIERPPIPKSLVTDELNQQYRHEIVIPFRSRNGGEVISTPISDPLIRTSFHPGSECLYVKIFAGPVTSDQWLSSEFIKISEVACLLGCEKPFFIRYSEEAPHLRVRLRGPADVLWTTIRENIERSLEPLIKVRAVGNVEYATYHPEYARYGGLRGLRYCEQIFGEDSLCTAKFLAQARRLPNFETCRWQFALQSVVGLAFALSNDVEDALSTIESLRDGYVLEFGVTHAELSSPLRRYKKEVTAIARGDRDERWSDLIANRDRFVANLRPTLLGAADVSEPLALRQSLLHMCVNRVMPELGRANEMALMDLAVKGLRGFVARNRP